MLSIEQIVIPENAQAVIHQLNFEVQKLKETNGELQNLLLYKTIRSANCNEFLNNLIKRLLVIANNYSEENKDFRHDMIQCVLQLKQFLNENIWNEFRLRFAEVHPDFYDKLIACYPVLTENDLRLCAFIKLKMSTKEIASVLNQSANSIKVARRRLREKLKIESTNEDLMNLLSFY